MTPKCALRHMTFISELDLAIVKVYMRTKN